MAGPEINKPIIRENPIYENAPDSPAKKTVDKIFSAFDPKGTGKIDFDQMYAVDKQDGNTPPRGSQSNNKTLSVWDIKKAQGNDKIDPKDATKTMSQQDFTELIGGKAFPEIEITKDDVIKKLSTDDKALKKTQAFLNGNVKPTVPEKKEPEKTEVPPPPAASPKRKFTTQYPITDEDKQFGTGRY